MKAAIGASMLEYMADPCDGGASKDAPPSGCLLYALLHHHNKNNIFIQGGALATTLAMDLAHSVASRHEPVLFLTCAKKTTHFPLFCSPEESNDDDDDDWQAKLRRIDEDSSSWNQRALKRIKVVHFQSWRDLMSHLLKLDPIKKPGVIIVDSIDSFVKEDSPTMTSDMTMQMVHIYAVAADTGRALKVPVVATTQTTPAPHAERMISNWFPNNVVCMEQKVQTNTDKEGEWIVKQKGGDNGSISLSITKRESDGANVIVWGPRSSSGT